MQRKNLNFIAIIAMILFMAGCKKDPTLIEAIPGQWKVTAQTIDGKDIFVNLETCEKDDITTFKADNSYLADEGATKCDTKDPQTKQNGTYTVSADEKILTLKSKGVISSSVDLTVVSYSESTLQLELVDGAEKLGITFTKQ